MVDRAEYAALQKRLVDVEKQAAEARAALQERAAHTAQLINSKCSDIIVIVS